MQYHTMLTIIQYVYKYYNLWTSCYKSEHNPQNKSIVKILIKSAHTFGPKYTGQIEWKLLLTVTDNVHVIRLK